MARKTIDVFQILVDYGQGKEYTCAEFTNSAARRTLNDYRTNCPEYPAVIKCKRENKKHYTIPQLQEIENDIKKERQLQVELRRQRLEKRLSTQLVGC